MQMNIGIEEKNRREVGALLNKILADEYVLYTKTRNYHWNIVGMQFNELHKFFESQYEAIEEIVDEVAERARTVGVPAAGTLAEFVKLTRLKENPGVNLSAAEMLKNLLEDHEAIIRILRVDLDVSNTKFGDMGTSDFLTGLMEEHEKMAWMLRSFLADKA